VASLSDLTSIYAPSGPEAGFVLGDIERRRTQAETGADIGKERILQNYQYELPDLLGSQAAKGSYFSSATNRKRARLGQNAANQTADIDVGLANLKADLAAQALLAQTGVRLNGGGY
jgi:hypothetical protein